jgi:hypothetical protein
MGKKMTEELRSQIETLLKENAGTAKIDQLVATQSGVPVATVRSVRRQLGIKAGARGRPKAKKKEEELPKQTDDLSRGDRVRRLQIKVGADPKYKVLEKTLDENEREMFLTEFTNIAVDMDSLDAFEESHLYTAVMNFVLGTRYAQRYQTQREAFERFCNSDFYGTEINMATLPRNMRPLPPDENLIEEFHKSTDNFNKIRDKFARIQEEKRKRVVGDKKTFSDFREYYAHEDKVSEASMEIRDILKETDAELKRMIKSGELEGFFERK